MTVLNFPTDDRNIAALCERAPHRIELNLGRHGIACAPLDPADLAESIIRNRKELFA